MSSTGRHHGLGPMPARVRKMLEEQGHQCGICFRPINNGNYFDADKVLICGRCALNHKV